MITSIFHFIRKFIGKIFIFILIILFSIFSLRNQSRIEIDLIFDHRIISIPLFVTIFGSMIIGILLNILMIFILGHKKHKQPN